MKLSTFDSAQAMCKERQQGPTAALHFWSSRARIYTEQGKYLRAADAFELAADYATLCAKVDP